MGAISPFAGPDARGAGIEPERHAISLEGGREELGRTRVLPLADADAARPGKIVG